MRKWDMINHLSDNARLFNNDNPNWHSDPKYNEIFLRSSETYLNELLARRGHLFLNEAYDQLGFSRSRAGVLAGWLAEKDKNAKVEFIIADSDGGMVIDFNVDGDIHDKI